MPPTTMYRVWEELNGSESYAEGRYEYGALSVELAATLHAKYRFGPDEGHERTWPHNYCVRNLTTGKLYRVAVTMEYVPEFTAAPAVEV